MLATKELPDVAEQQVVVFKYGIPGFEDVKEFYLEDIEEYPPFKMFQAKEYEDIAMIVINAQLLSSYEYMKIPSAELRKLDIKDPNNVEMYVILRANQEEQQFTANTKAPIIINLSNMRGNQVILDSNQLSSQNRLDTLL